VPQIPALKTFLTMIADQVEQQEEVRDMLESMVKDSKWLSMGFYKRKFRTSR
jgi:hypothetical protein